MNDVSTARGPINTTIFVLLAGAAVYFAGSAAAPALVERWEASGAGAAALTWGVQLGFVIGTLGATALDLPDRLSPGRFIALLLVLGSAASAALLVAPDIRAAVGLRVAAGALAGPVYPIGMRLLATWTPNLASSYGKLLGAYTLGVGAAAFLRSADVAIEPTLLATSALGLAGAFVAWTRLAPGPRLPARAALDLAAARKALAVRRYRWSSFAYYGHMWELFALWGLLPLWIVAAGWSMRDAAILMALVFLAGAAACVAAGRWAARSGEPLVATVALAVSGSLCALSPFLFDAPRWVLAPAVVLWGAAVIMDSPLYSALSARAAPPAYVGSALTLQNGLGFALTIPALALVGAIADASGWRWALAVLAPGPVVGLWFTTRLMREYPATDGERRERRKLGPTTSP